MKFIVDYDGLDGFLKYVLNVLLTKVGFRS